jgi:pyruvate/2-oxoglutarate dehydrogenase complex dihydrolipoamide dehydrogenase (E3) component
MARRLTFEGLKVKGVFELMPWPGGLERNVRQCLMDFGIPLELSHTVVEVKGRDRLTSVVVAAVDGGGLPIAGTEREVRCDTLLLSVGLIPENELSKRAGVELSPRTGGAVVDERLMTSVPGIFSCGNVLHIHDVADWASFEGVAAGEAAARWAAGETREPERLRVSAGARVRYALPQRLARGVRNFELSFRVTEPIRGATIVVRERGSGKVLARKKFGRVLPSELQKIKVRAAVREDLEVACRE